MKKNDRRHLREHEVTAVCEWIKSQQQKPRWDEVVELINQLFGLKRTLQSVMKNDAFKTAMRARAKVQYVRPTLGKPTKRKLETMTEEIDRLKVKIAELEAQNLALIEERIEMINFAKSRCFTESDIRRPLIPVDRNASRLPKT